MNLDTYKQITMKLANKPTGTEKVITKTYAVYSICPMIPQGLRLGVPTLEETTRIADSCIYSAIIEVAFSAKCVG